MSSDPRERFVTRPGDIVVTETPVQRSLRRATEALDASFLRVVPRLRGLDALRKRVSL